jgi:hypothetical protein
MSKVSLTSLMVLCAAVAACSDGSASRTVTAPDVKPAFSEASADFNIGYTVDEPFDLTFATGDAFAQLGAVQMAAAAQAASGGRASGHVGFPSGLPGLGIASEKYSFVALSTDPSTPFAAKGQYELELTTTAGRQNRIHGDVICVGISGNTARIAGQITKVWVNNVQVPITARTHNYWVVVDNGEGQGTPDQVSPMAFTVAAGAQAHCAAGLPSIVFANQEGNVQVQP